MRFSLQAADPVIVVDEEFSLGAATAMTINLAKNLLPEHVLYRHGKGGVGTVATWRIANDAEPVFVLEPWLRWWERLRQGLWFGLYRNDDPDLLAIGACQASVWVDPQDSRKRLSDRQILVTQDGQDVIMTLPLEEGRRRWLIGAMDRDASLEVLHGDNLCRAPVPQKHFIRHGDFPLDRIKDCIMDWPGDHDNYPRLFVNKADLPGIRDRFEADPARLAEYRLAPVSPYTLDEPVRYYLGTGDTELGRHLAEAAERWLQDVVRMYCDQDELLGPGFAPHHQTALLTALNLTDAVLGTDFLSPAVRRRLRAQIAFLGYTVDREDFWSPERGFSGNPNMTTTVAAFKTAVACMIPSHPMASTWLRHGMAELKDNQLDHWSDANGGWLEAPHYAMVSYDYLLGCFLMARNAGFGDHLLDPKMREGRRVVRENLDTARFATVRTSSFSTHWKHLYQRADWRVCGSGLSLEGSRSRFRIANAMDASAARITRDTGHRRFFRQLRRLPDIAGRRFHPGHARPPMRVSCFRKPESYCATPSHPTGKPNCT